MEQFGALGVTPDWFTAYPAEFSFCLGHQQMYGQAPTSDIVSTKFPDFPFVASARDVRYAVTEMRRRRTRRDLSRVLETAAEAVARDDVEQAVQLVSSYAPQSMAAPATNLLWDSDLLSAEDDTSPAIDVPWATVQQATGGIRPGQFWAVGARLGNGKSWMLIRMAVEAMLQGKRVGFYALEMPKKEVLARVHGTLAVQRGETAINFDRLQHRAVNWQDYRRFVSETSASLPGAEFFLFGPEDGRCTPAALQARAADVDILFVDHLTLMRTDTGQAAITDWRAVGEISNGVRQATLATNIPVVAAVQVNRLGEGQSNRRSEHRPPRLHHLSQGDTIGQDADVAFTHVQTSRETQALAVRKIRNGASDKYFWTQFHPGIGKFAEISREEHNMRADGDL